MTTALSSPTRRFVMEDVSWDYYDRTLHEIQASGRRMRITYDDGMMEYMVIGDEHERTKTTFGRLLEYFCAECDIPITGLGSVTCRRKRLKKGLEPDECYYITTPPPPVGRQLDLNRYPPPDLAIEIDITRVSIPRQPIYAALRIPEVWRYDGKDLTILRLQDTDIYKPSSASIVIPSLPLPDFTRWIKLAMTRSQHEAILAIRAHLRRPGRMS